MIEKIKEKIKDNLYTEVKMNKEEYYLERKRQILNKSRIKCLQVIIILGVISIIASIDWILVPIPFIGFPLIYYFISGENIFVTPFMEMLENAKEKQKINELYLKKEMKICKK